MEALIQHCWNCNEKAEIPCLQCNFALYCSKRCMKQDIFRHQVECNFLSVKGPCAQCGKIAEVQSCGSCRLDRYCSRRCQKVHWEKHRPKCEGSQNHCNALVLSWGKLGSKCIDMPWYWGNSLAADYLKLIQNEGVHCKQKCFTLLFAACGDLRNVFKTMADLPSTYKGKIKFYLNDYSSHIMARNILFLFLCVTIEDKLISSSLIVQLWYSLLLSDDNYTILLKSLELLIEIDSIQLKKLTQNLVEIAQDDWAIVQIIFSGWLFQHRLVDKTKMQTQWLQRSCGPVTKEFLDEYLSGVPVHHLNSLKKWLYSGLIVKDNEKTRAKASKPNLTLLCFNPLHHFILDKFPELNNLAILRSDWSKYITEADWMILFWDGRSMPFRGWDYLDIVKSEGLQDDVVEMFQSYVNKVVNDFISQIRQKKASFHIMVKDILDIAEWLPKDLKFDRIATSNTADYCRSQPLLGSLGCRLNSNANPNSVLVVEYRNWNLRYSLFSSNLPDAKAKDTLAVLSCVGDLMKRPSSRDEIKNLKTYINDERSRSEYIDDFLDFLMILRAERLTDDFERRFRNKIEVFPPGKQEDMIWEMTKEMFKPYKIPDHKDLYHYGEVQMRKFWKELNRILPFRYKINARRVSHVIGSERSIEWVARKAN